MDAHGAHHGAASIDGIERQQETLRSIPCRISSVRFVGEIIAPADRRRAG